jgi:hypothetical protein
LRQHCSIDVAYAPTFASEQVRHLGQKDQAGNILVLGVIGREVDPFITQGRCPKQGVQYGVNQHVAVAVPGQPQRIRNLDAAQNQPPPGGEGVSVESYADSEVCWGQARPPLK